MERGKGRPDAQAPGDQGLSDLSEDAADFGRVELRTVRHMLVRPAKVLAAYMDGGPTGHGVYSRPLRLYLTLCGFMMLVLFFTGGTTATLEQLERLQVSGIDIDDLAQQAGKTREAFLSDGNDWITLLIVPVGTLLYVPFIAPLLRWWDPANLGWRRSFRATLTYLNAWTIPLLPLSWMAWDRDYAGVSAIALTGLGIIAFMRTGRGRWFRTTAGGLTKCIALVLVTQLAGLVAFPILAGVGLLGGLYGN